jgi:hypothetical protein
LLNEYLPGIRELKDFGTAVSAELAETELLSELRDLCD